MNYVGRVASLDSRTYYTRQILDPVHSFVLQPRQLKGCDGDPFIVTETTLVYISDQWAPLQKYHCAQ